MIRELILVSCDISRATFPRDTESMLPSEGSVIIISDIKDAHLFSIGPVAMTEAKTRLQEGDFCVVVLDAHGLAAEMWATEHPRYIDWIGCKIVPEKNHVHLYNAWVRPDVRGPGLQWRLAWEACKGVIRRGKSKVFAGVERAEYAPFARKYAAMGLGLLKPIRSIWAGKLLGITIAVPVPPPAVLAPAMANARNILLRKEH